MHVTVVELAPEVAAHLDAERVVIHLAGHDASRFPNLPQQGRGRTVHERLAWLLHSHFVLFSRFLVTSSRRSSRSAISFRCFLFRASSSARSSAGKLAEMTIAGRCFGAYVPS